MTREDITKIAREAGLHLATDVNWMPIIGIEYLEAFAALVAAQEREACAKVCDEKWIYTASPSEMAEYIRARGQEMERKPANAHDKVYSEVELANAYQKGWNDAMLRSSLGMARGQE